MYSLNADPYVASKIAHQQIEERLREAEARRLVREVRRGARTDRPSTRPRPHWSVPELRHWLMSWAAAESLRPSGR